MDPPSGESPDPAWPVEGPWDGQPRPLWRGVPESVSQAHRTVERAHQVPRQKDPLQTLRAERAFERQRKRVERWLLSQARQCDPEPIEDDDLYDSLIADPQLSDYGEQLAEEYRALAQRARGAQDRGAVEVLVQYAKADLEPEWRWYIGQLAKLRGVIEAEGEEVQLEPESPALSPLQPGFGELLYRSWLKQQGQHNDHTPVALAPAPAFRTPIQYEPPGAARAQLMGYAFSIEPSPPARPPRLEQFANWLARLVGIAPREPSRRSY